MKRLKLTIAIILAISSLYSYAQDQQSVNAKYSISIEDGILASVHHFGIEKTVVNGVAINRKHVVGIGIGFGFGTFSINNDPMYCPLFANYRYYFTPGDFSPHINFSLGGIIFSEGQGLYSTLMAGFRKYKFTFSSGIFFQAYQYRKTYYTEIYDGNGFYQTTITSSKLVQEFPIGFAIKLGVAF